jgi:TnpA family transposase
MADLIQGISYKQLRRVSDWQMTQEAHRAALAAVVHAISRLDTTIYWGRGRTAASDRQRFALQIVGWADRTIDPQTVVDHWNRMGQIYASPESGHTTASVALQRLVFCTPKNHFYRANRDLGRVFKTEFLLSYLSEPRLRARIRRGLLNGKTSFFMASMCSTRTTFAKTDP